MSAKDLHTDFCVLSSYGTSRFFTMIYCDEDYSAWILFSSDIRYMRLSQDDAGNLDFLDFDGGPSISRNYDMMGCGIVDSMWIFENPKDSKNSAVILVLCRNADVLKKEKVENIIN